MLELCGLTGGYGATTVLRDVDLVVPASSVVALLGPNGAGKTTLLKTVSGLLRPQSGIVRLDGEDVTPLDPDDRVARGLCHIPEGRGIFRSLSVRENLELFVADGDRRDEVVEIFPRLGERLGQIAGTMSGGEQQMLALARAWMSGARLVMVDEASMGLAPAVVDELFGFLDRLKADGVSLLIVEQYVDKALAIADYVYILARGSVAFAGDPDELAGEDVFARYLNIDIADQPRDTRVTTG